MTTTYPGRENEFDLGDGHSFTWLIGPDGTCAGLIEHHPPGRDAIRPERSYCGGSVFWQKSTDNSWDDAYHELRAGSPGDEAHLTVHPSLLCPACGRHGWIRDGVWENA